MASMNVVSKLDPDITLLYREYYLGAPDGPGSETYISKTDLTLSWKAEAPISMHSSTHVQTLVWLKGGRI